MALRWWWCIGRRVGGGLKPRNITEKQTQFWISLGVDQCQFPDQCQSEYNTEFRYTNIWKGSRTRRPKKLHKSSIRPLIIWEYRNSVQKEAQKRLCNFWSVWPSKNCLCKFSRFEKLHNERNSFRDECFGIARKHSATGVRFVAKSPKKTLKLGVGWDLPEFHFLNHFFVQKD